jgi:alkylation response protein AidB-like acyl-CoA dehydrogenase
MRELTGIDTETLDIILQTLRRLAEKRITLDDKLRWDETEEFPLDLIRELVGEELGLHLVFLPEAYGGLGGGARDIARVSEEMAKIDLGVATSFLSISLGTDPIIVGCTPEQKEKWLGRIAEGAIVAYAVTEPEAGSNVQSIKTTAARITDAGGKVTGYRINGAKQFISNGGYADLFTVLANTPDGPTFFVVEKGTKGLLPGKHEEKHGIRCSNTAPVVFEDLEIPAENIVGTEEGQGLKQANQVFGYTRLMVAAFGLGGGVAALDRAVAYSRERLQFGKPLSEFQGYTHKLIVPFAVRLEAARAFIEQTAGRLDGGEQDLQVEGSIAKYFATEAGNATADAAIQALGGYGYIREYEVEKIKRDVKITCIYEGTSEIQQNIIGLFRMRENVRSKGRYYGDLGEEMAALGGETGGPVLADACRLAGEASLFFKKSKLTRQQHALFTLADMLTAVEVGAALCRKASGDDSPALRAAARLYAAETLRGILDGASALSLGMGASGGEDLAEAVRAVDRPALSRTELADMDTVCAGIYVD